VTGGYVYRGQALPEWQEIYFYGDYCSGAIWGLTSPPQGAAPVLLFQTGFKISTFGVDQDGELYVADYAGTIYRLEKRP
jgi:glucose/arabinose dehydrogenase